MSRQIVLLLSLFNLLLLSPSAYAGYEGPIAVIEGQWGNGDADFGFDSGEPIDAFPGLVRVDDIGNIIIGDGVNFRIKMYGPTGSWQRNLSYKNITPIGGWPANLSVKAGIGIITIYQKLQKYDYNGNLVMDIQVPGTRDYWVTDDGAIWLQDVQYKYHKYSPSGQIMQSTSEFPLELGKVKSDKLGERKYKMTITYLDKVYSISSDRKHLKYLRDMNGKVYGINPSGVWRFNQCGKIDGSVIMPKADIDKAPGEGREELSVHVNAQYGEPVVAPNGDVYTWKRSPDKYSILKWIWVDDPNVPTGPDAPSGLTVTPSTKGLYLTWTSSPGDPGCVTSYEISRATSAGGAGTTVGTVTAGTVTYNDSSVTAGTTYYYKVRAKAGNEYSPYTAETSGKR